MSQKIVILKQDISVPGAGVESVAGRSGVVTLTKSDVGLANVDNTSNATERAATATLTNKTLTAPVVNNPTGIVKGDVGLGNVDNTSNATERAASATLTNKTIVGANNTISGITEAMLTTADNTTLNVSTSKHGFVPKAPNDATKYLNGVGAYSVPAGSGGGSSPFIMAKDNGIAPGNSAATNTTALQALIDANTIVGATIYFTEAVPMNGGITVKNNIRLIGDNWAAMKGSAPAGGASPSLANLPSGAAFLITDETNVFMTLQSHTAIDGIIFDYPDQDYAATDSADLIVYPTTILKKSGEPVSQISITRCTFMGNTTCIDFASTATLSNFCADLTFDLLYGYPLGGGFINIAYGLDIPRITRCHVNPSVGLYRCYATSNDLAFTNEIIDYVSSNGAAAFELYKTDEFMMSQCFSFASKIAFFINDCYGTLVNCEADATGVGCWITLTSDYKYVSLIGFNAINAAGSLADRNGVVFDGTGGKLYCVSLHGITSTTGVVPASSVAGANSLLKVSGSGAQRVSIYGARTRSVAGAYAKLIDQTNASAIINYTDSDQQDVTSGQNAGQLPSLVLTTTPLGVPSGGTGAATLAAHGLLVGNGTSAVAVTGAGTAGQVLTSNGASADPTFQAATGVSAGNNNALFTSTASAANDHVASDTTIVGTGVGSKTTGANYFAAGTSLLVIARGTVDTPAALGGDLMVKIKAGSVTVGSVTITPTASLSGSVFEITALVTCRTAGASGAFMINGIFAATGVALTPLEGKITNSGSAVDTTGTIAWDLTAAWSNTTAGDVITGTNFVMFTPGTGIADPGSNGILSRTAVNTVSALAIPLTVPNGGSALSTTTAYSPLFSGTTATGTWKGDTGPGTSGQVLTSTGAGSYPTWQAPTGGDFLGVLSSAEIAITNASTTLTIGRMHAIKATSANQTNALPAAASNAGKFIAARITTDSTKFVTLDGNGSETIQGALTRIFWAGEVVWLMSDGTNWVKHSYAFVPLRAKSYVTGTSQDVVTATITKILVNASDYASVASMWDSGNNRITVPRPGSYIATAYMTWGPLTAASNNTQAKLYLSGTEVVGDSREAANGGYPTPKVTVEVVATTADYFELYGYQTAGSNQILYLSDPKLNFVQITEVPSW